MRHERITEANNPIFEQHQLFFYSYELIVCMLMTSFFYDLQNRISHTFCITSDYYRILVDLLVS